MIFSRNLRDQTEAIFASRKDKSDYVPYEFVIYKGLPSASGDLWKFRWRLIGLGTTHGFASRPDLSNQIIKEAYEKGLEQTVSWFKRTL